MQRKLASIQVIESISPIAGADNIEQARVLGWTVVVKKNEFAPGDKCVFFEIDALLPNGASWAEFMRSRNFRIKTVRLRGVLSQGLALPLFSFCDGGNHDGAKFDTCCTTKFTALDVDTDVTEMLGITKYEAPEYSSGGPNRVKANGGIPFPARVPKTDEIRLQSVLGVLDELRGKPFVVTTKLDGCSATFVRDLDGTLVVASRKWSQPYDTDNAWWKVAERYNLAERLPVGFALQGELCGPGIQQNRLMLREHDVFMFNAYDVVNGRYLDHVEFVELCERVGVKTVPIDMVVQGADADSFEHTLDGWLERAKGIYTSTKNRREGIVVRPLTETYSPRLKGRLSFKVISNEFLLNDEL